MISHCSGFLPLIIELDYSMCCFVSFAYIAEPCSPPITPVKQGQIKILLFIIILYYYYFLLTCIICADRSTPKDGRLCKESKSV